VTVCCGGANDGEVPMPGSRTSRKGNQDTKCRSTTSDRRLDLYVDRIRLPCNRQFEFNTEWPATLLLVPSSPDFLPEREWSTYVPTRSTSTTFISNGPESEEPDFATSRTTTQLIHQLEARAQTRRWVLVGTIAGLITLSTVVAGLCLTRRSQMTAFLGRR
jgi:hypothetical protein